MVEDVGNERIGQAVALLRRGSSQQAVADAMRARGHEKWSQSTVWAVEKGTRPLRLAEAQDLASVLGCQLWELTRTPPEVELLVSLDKAASAYFTLKQATYDYLVAQNSLAVDVERVESEGVPIEDGTMGRAKQWLGTPALDAFDAGTEKYESVIEGDF